MSEQQVQLGEAQAAFEAVRPRLEALAASDVRQPRVDPQRAAVATLSLLELAQPHWPRVEELAARGFLPAEVPELGQVALAAWYARHRFRLAQQTSTQAMVPAAVAEEATALRQRMLKVAAYHLEDTDAGAARTLAAIRSGTGFQDLASDLVGLAELYARYRSVLAADRVFYRDADEPRANELAAEILRSLGLAGANREEWGDLQARAWTLLDDLHERLLAALGLIMPRHEAARLRSLVGSVRARPTAAGGAEAGDAGAADPGGAADAGGAGPNGAGANGSGAGGPAEDGAGA